MKHIDLRLKQKNINGFTAKKMEETREHRRILIYSLKE